MESRVALDPSRCPLCGGANGCAMAAGCNGEACWCTKVTVTAAMLERVPAERRGVACFCAACIARLAADAR
jgi:Cysteine-rich CWC